MKAAHRRAHLVIWPVLLLLLVAGLVVAIGGRPEAPVQEPIPGVAP